MIVDLGEQNKRHGIGKTYIDVLVTLLFLSVIKSKVLCCFHLPSMSFSYPFYLLLEHQNKQTNKTTLYKIKCTVPGLQAKFTNT